MGEWVTAYTLAGYAYCTLDLLDRRACPPLPPPPPVLPVPHFADATAAAATVTAPDTVSKRRAGRCRRALQPDTGPRRGVTGGDPPCLSMSTATAWGGGAAVGAAPLRTARGRLSAGTDPCGGCHVDSSGERGGRGGGVSRPRVKAAAVTATETTVTAHTAVAGVAAVAAFASTTVTGVGHPGRPKHPCHFPRFIEELPPHGQREWGTDENKRYVLRKQREADRYHSSRK